MEKPSLKNTGIVVIARGVGKPAKRHSDCTSFPSRPLVSLAHRVTPQGRSRSDQFTASMP